MHELPVEELNKISFASFVFHLRATTDLDLPPYKGSTLRGAFGTVFKETVCVMDHRDCDRCILRLKCAYPYIFDTPIPEGATRMRKYERAPHPFIIEPPLETQQLYKPNEPFVFGLTLIGKAIDYLPYFIYAFERMGVHSGIGKGRRFGSGLAAMKDEAKDVVMKKSLARLVTSFNGRIFHRRMSLNCSTVLPQNC